MYSSTMELPTQVTNSLSPADAEVWMNSYNQCLKSFRNPNEATLLACRKKAWHDCAKLPSSFSFRIVASVEDIDIDREIIDVDSIKKNLDPYILGGGPIAFDHSSYEVGCCWDWTPITKNGMPGVEVWGNVYGGTPVYDSMRKLFMNGVNSLSVAGAGTSGHFQCDNRGCYTRKGVAQLMEISLCKVPANPHATLSWFHEGVLAKSAHPDDHDHFRLNVDEVEIHKDENNCPILSLRKSLRAIGYDAHAREEGVFIPMSKSRYDADCKQMIAHGLVPEWMGDGVLLNDRAALVEKSFKDGIEKGYLDENGRVTDKINGRIFKSMFDKGLLMNDGIDFWLKPI